MCLLKTKNQKQKKELAITSLRISSAVGCAENKTARMECSRKAKQIQSVLGIAWQKWLVVFVHYPEDDVFLLEVQIIGCAVWYNFGKERKTPQLHSWSVYHWLWQPNSLHSRYQIWLITQTIHATGLSTIAASSAFQSTPIRGLRSPKSRKNICWQIILTAQTESTWKTKTVLSIVCRSRNSVSGLRQVLFRRAY